MKEKKCCLLCTDYKRKSEAKLPFGFTMKIPLLLLVFLLTCMACSKRPILPFAEYNVSSMLNDSIWFATGEAVEQTDTLAKPCISHRFDLFIKTDIPYPGFLGKGFIQDSITGCTGECRPSQMLTIFNIPIKKGKFQITRLSRCGLPFTNYLYFWSGYSGGLVRAFFLEDRKAGWVRVKRYDSKTGLVEGRFKGTFADSTGRLARFERGAFQVVVKQRKIVNQ
ncbi:hypothetical protein [Persicitalea jodogahamensis]|uniref:hypothetical protein n=1 Tax=Persicitalea jodogahamensis TaxID=402147 RepID=UPI0016769BE3|nr:hypothetical protein [Persicitalea jodogahamensis]